MTAEAQVRASAHASLAEAHRRLLADHSLQFHFDATPLPKPPAWLKPLFELLQAIAPFLGYAFWTLLAAGLLFIVFLIAREIMRVRWPERFRAGDGAQLQAEPEWRPSEAAARALLEDVDRLAAQGRFAEAVHLLLFRSIEDIQGQRPHLVRPALTSRDIARAAGLPEAARTAFSGIARIVERSHFGGAPVGADDFAACRNAYEAFALPGIWS